MARRAPAGGAGEGEGSARVGRDGSAEGRCEAPARREPWREAAARRPLQCPGPQQRPRPPPRGPPGRRPRAPRAPDGRALRARRPRRGAARGRVRAGAPAPRRAPRPGPPDPQPGSAESAGGQQEEEEAPQPSSPRAPRCRPAGCCGANRSRRAAGTRLRTTRRRRPGLPSAWAAPRRRPLGSRLRRGRASCASRGLLFFMSQLLLEDFRST
ncbi:proline-rich protein 2-like [Hippopotamus amphibius kiboko]|uniref:proline-rich protein 2-like n=1 Tax=Hippopotamus amphibius kiboko TaxID=575201 RepID=UPI002595DCE6|nr:proline-rich protein 2-like [Hippopotamus amphibius kiboko]